MISGARGDSRPSRDEGAGEARGSAGPSGPCQASQVAWTRVLRERR